MITTEELLVAVEAMHVEAIHNFNNSNLPTQMFWNGYAIAIGEVMARIKPNNDPCPSISAHPGNKTNPISQDQAAPIASYTSVAS